MISEQKQKELAKRMAKLGLLESEIDERFILGGGKGGQAINKRSSCVQLKHIPSGIIVKSQKDRSREANRFFARRLLCEAFEKKTRNG